MSNLLVNKLSGDNVVYDIQIYGEPNKNNRAVFNINRTDNVIDNPSDYYLAILDFSIPLFAIPLFSFIDNRYKFSLEFDGLILENTLLWVPETINSSPVFQSVYSYQAFITSMNNSLKTLYDNMVLAKPLFLATEQPFITFNNNRLTLNISEWYYLNNSFVLYNDQLSNFITSIPAFYITATLIRILYNNHMPSYIRSGIKYYAITQENVDLSNWNSLLSIVISTNQIPVAGELLATQSNETILVLGDFVNLNDENRVGFYNYISKAPLRLCNLNSSYPLSTIDCEIRWFNKEGNSEIIQIPVHQSAFIKLVFVKREFEDLNEVENSGYGIR